MKLRISVRLKDVSTVLLFVLLLLNISSREWHSVSEPLFQKKFQKFYFEFESSAVYRRPKLRPVHLELKKFRTDILDSHNMYRIQHCVPIIKPNASMDEISQNLAKKFALDRHQKSAPLKQLGYSWYAGPIARGEEILTTIYKRESQEFDFDSLEISTKNSRFTQMIWAESQELGVGVTFKESQLYLVLTYFPPGNVKKKTYRNVLRNTCDFSRQNAEQQAGFGIVVTLLVLLCLYGVLSLLRALR